MKMSTPDVNLLFSLDLLIGPLIYVLLDPVTLVLIYETEITMLGHTGIND